MEQAAHLNFVLKPFLTPSETETVKALEAKCVHFDHTTLKLELDYKLSAANTTENQEGTANDVLCYDGGRLVGYAGVMRFGGAEPEVCGMVDPDYRRQGIASALLWLIKKELSNQHISSALLLSDRQSTSGQSFIKSLGAEPRHSEYEMFLKLPWEHKVTEDMKKGIKLRKATNADAAEVNRQNAIYFNQEVGVTEAGTVSAQQGSDPEGDLEFRLLPEEEEARGMTIYLAEDGEKLTIGKIHLENRHGKGGIFGLGILPAYRGQGYGRALLLSGVEALLRDGAERVYLQVNAVNENALKLYLSCGFEVASTMDYFRLKL